MVSPKIVIFKEKDSLKVTASVDPIGDHDDKVRLTLKEIEAHLESKGIKHGACLKADVLTNGLKSKNMAEWVFELPGKKKIKVEPSSGNVFKDIECDEPEEKLEQAKKKTTKKKARKKKPSKLAEELIEGIKEIGDHNEGKIELKTTEVILSSDETKDA